MGLMDWLFGPTPFAEMLESAQRRAEEAIGADVRAGKLDRHWWDEEKARLIARRERSGL